MNSDNPYQPPASKLEQQTDAVCDFTNPRHLPPGRGWFWITEGFHLFAKSPGIWILNMIIFFIITFIIALLPIISIANYILQPIFTGGLMRGAHTLDNGGTLEVSHLFAGFNEKGGKLALLGALQLGMMVAYGIVIGIIALIVFGASALLANNGESFSPEMIFTSTAFIVFIPLFFISMLLLGMAVWLSPQLVMLHDLDVVSSIKMSFIGSWRNIVPIIIFGMTALFLTLIAIIPLGLGLLVMWPTLTAATYVAWKDIFTDSYPIE